MDFSTVGNGEYISFAAMADPQYKRAYINVLQVLEHSIEGKAMYLQNDMESFYSELKALCEKILWMEIKLIMLQFFFLKQI